MYCFMDNFSYALTYMLFIYVDCAFNYTEWEDGRLNESMIMKLFMNAEFVTGWWVVSLRPSNYPSLSSI